MKCKKCNEVEVIKVNQPAHVKFECKQGHVWFEDYVDHGGTQKRPKSYKVKIQDILFPTEKQLYDKILCEIDRNEIFFTSATAEEIMNYLIKKCKYNRNDIYKLFKKITDFDKNKE